MHVASTFRAVCIYWHFYFKIRFHIICMIWVQSYKATVNSICTETTAFSAKLLIITAKIDVFFIFFIISALILSKTSVIYKKSITFAFIYK